MPAVLIAAITALVVLVPSVNAMAPASQPDVGYFILLDRDCPQAPSGFEIIHDYGYYSLVRGDVRTGLAISSGGVPLEYLPDQSIIDLVKQPIDTKKPQALSLPDEFTISQYPAGQAGMYLVQFIGPIDSSWPAIIEDAGGVILDYVSNNAFIVDMTPEAANTLENVPVIQYVGIFQPYYKFQEGLEQFTGTQEYILLIDEGTDAHELLGQNGDIFLSVHNVFHDAKDYVAIVEFPAALLPEVVKLNGVLWVEKYQMQQLENYKANQIVQSGSLINAQFPIWYQGIRGEGQILSYADSGLDGGPSGLNHYAFKDPSVSTAGPSHRKVIGYYNTADNHDDGPDTGSEGHGTHIAGTLVGDDSANGGTNVNDGIAMKGKLYVEDIGSNGGVSGSSVSYSNAYSAGARTFSNSWVSVGDSTYNSFARTCDQYMYANSKMLIVNCAGNQGSDANTVNTPGTAKDIITSGSAFTDYPDSVDSQSSRGPNPGSNYDRIKPTMITPGNGIISAKMSTTNEYTLKMGTSMSTPVAAGTSALVRQYYEDGWYPSGTKTSGDSMDPSAALIKATMVAACKDMGVKDVPNQNEGYGRPILSSALYFASNSTKNLQVVDDTTGLTTGNSDSIDIAVELTSDFKVALVWTDIEASTSSTYQLVNDLDLTVSGPSGVFHGNEMTDGYSDSGSSSHDRRNVEEIVNLKSYGFTAGTYTITVDAYDVPSGSQPYALVVLGKFGTAGPSVPSAPQSLSATANGADTIDLSWSAPASDGGSAITGYKVYRGTSAGAQDPTPITTVGAGTTAYSDSGLAPGTYYYIVKAENGIGIGASSNEATDSVGVVEIGGTMVALIGLVAIGASCAVMAVVARRE